MARSRNLVFLACIMGLLVISGQPTFAEKQDFWYDQPAAVPRANAGAPSEEELPTGSGLTSLASRIGEAGREHFEEFFGVARQSVIVVEPFVFISSSGQRRVTELGVLIADQMVVALDNAVLSRGPDDASKALLLKGALQEIDGRLRIHMVGIDGGGRNRSLVITVDMSKAIFRSLHAY